MRSTNCNRNLNMSRHVNLVFSFVQLTVYLSVCVSVYQFYDTNLLYQAERARAEGQLQHANEQLHRQNIDLQHKDQQIYQKETEIQQARSQLQQKDVELHQKYLELNNSQQHLQVALHPYHTIICIRYYYCITCRGYVLKYCRKKLN